MSQSRHVKLMSAKQRRANRRNAQRSTGPRTDEGKARAAQNAVDHGNFCKELLLPGEDPQEFTAFRGALVKGLDPRDALERSIAEQYVEAKWRIRRVRGAEREAHGQLATQIEFDLGRGYLELRSRLSEVPRLEALGPDDYDPRPSGDDPRGRPGRARAALRRPPRARPGERHDGRGVRRAGSGPVRTREPL